MLCVRVETPQMKPMSMPTQVFQVGHPTQLMLQVAHPLQLARRATERCHVAVLMERCGLRPQPWVRPLRNPWTRSSVVVDQKKKIQKRTTTTRRRRHKARFFCVEMICVVVVSKKKKSVCFVAPFNNKCRENIEEALTKREREEEATQKKGIKLSRKKKEISQNI